MQAEVLWVDRFGNCQLNVDPATLTELGAAPGDTIEIRMGETGRRARWAHAFADANPSELLLIVDSYGSFALAYDRQSAAAQLKLRAGSTLTLVPGPRTTMRWGTSITLVALILVILLAAIAQFVIKL